MQLVLALVLVLALSRGRPATFGLRRGDPGSERDLLLRGFFPVVLLSLTAGHAAMPVVQDSPPDRFADGLPDVADAAGLVFFPAVLVGRGLAAVAGARDEPVAPACGRR